jgi:hypothetical protein
LTIKKGEMERREIFERANAYDEQCRIISSGIRNTEGPLETSRISKCHGFRHLLHHFVRQFYAV